jgi:hypothetical protein
VTLLAYSPTTWTEVLVGASIIVPVAVSVALAWVILRGKAADPDEQRWARLAEERRDADRKPR